MVELYRLDTDGNRIAKLDNNTTISFGITDLNSVSSEVKFEIVNTDDSITYRNTSIEIGNPNESSVLYDAMISSWPSLPVMNTLNVGGMWVIYTIGNNSTAFHILDGVGTRGYPISLGDLLPLSSKLFSIYIGIPEVTNAIGTLRFKLYVGYDITY